MILFLLFFCEVLYLVREVPLFKTLTVKFHFHLHSHLKRSIINRFIVFLLCLSVCVCGRFA